MVREAVSGTLPTERLHTRAKHGRIHRQIRVIDAHCSILVVNTDGIDPEQRRIHVAVDVQGGEIHRPGMGVRRSGLVNKPAHTHAHRPVAGSLAGLFGAVAPRIFGSEIGSCWIHGHILRGRRSYIEKNGSQACGVHKDDPFGVGVHVFLLKPQCRVRDSVDRCDGSHRIWIHLTQWMVHGGGEERVEEL